MLRVGGAGQHDDILLGAPPQDKLGYGGLMGGSKLLQHGFLAPGFEGIAMGKRRSGLHDDSMLLAIAHQGLVGVVGMDLYLYDVGVESCGGMEALQLW